MITLESYINNIDHLDILDGYSLENGSINMIATEGNFRDISEYGAYRAIVAVVASIKKAIHRLITWINTKIIEFRKKFNSGSILVPKKVYMLHEDINKIINKLNADNYEDSQEEINKLIEMFEKEENIHGLGSMVRINYASYSNNLNTTIKRLKILEKDLDKFNNDIKEFKNSDEHDKLMEAENYKRSYEAEALKCEYLIRIGNKIMTYA